MKCALCGLEKELQISHIVPKFVGKYLKEISIGNIRSEENPNKTIQDIEKRELLCHDCEELFSASERSYANTIFYPYLREKKDEFTYDKRSSEKIMHDFLKGKRNDIGLIQNHIFFFDRLESTNAPG